MNTATNNFDTMKSTLYADYSERFKASCERARQEASAADPATNGNPSFCHYWGNEEARAAWRAHHDRNAKDYAETMRAIAAERHAEHIREDRANPYPPLRLSFSLKPMAALHDCVDSGNIRHRSPLPRPAEKVTSYLETTFSGLIRAREVTRFCDTISRSEMITVQIEDTRSGYTRGEQITTHARCFVKKAPSRGSCFIQVSTLPPAIY